MHKNPIVRDTIKSFLDTHDRVLLTDPLNYDDLVAVIKSCHIVLTDSGGLQEEAPSLGKPVLVLRSNTERQEAIEAGTAKLIGTSIDNIVKETTNLLTNKESYDQMARVKNPYGDGNSSKRVLEAVMKFLEQKD